MCANMCFCIYMCFLSFFFSSFSSVYLFCLSTLICLAFIYLILLYSYSLDACFLMRYKKVVEPDGTGGTGRTQGSRNCNQNILTKKKINCQFEKASL